MLASSGHIKEVVPGEGGRINGGTTVLAVTIYKYLF